MAPPLCHLINIKTYLKSFQQRIASLLLTGCFSIPILYIITIFFFFLKSYMNPFQLMHISEAVKNLSQKARSTNKDIQKHRQTRKYYATYNALLELKELMLNETSLLNSIISQVIFTELETCYKFSLSILFGFLLFCIFFLK